MKVGTFKITKQGLRLGERFLKIIFDNALEWKVDEIYVTMFENKRKEVKQLKTFLEEWGFFEYTKNNNGEIVLVKTMKYLNLNKTPKFNYPLQKKYKKCFWFLPIKFQYHTKLFPDLYLKNENLNMYDEQACQYAIEKIYITKWNYKSINMQPKPGDIICIYRMAENCAKYRSVVTGIAILNEIKYMKYKEDFINECKNKTVFSEEELNNFYSKKEYKCVIKLLFLKPLNNNVVLNSLWQNNILNPPSGPRIFQFISEENFKKILELSNN